MKFLKLTYFFCGFILFSISASHAQITVKSRIDSNEILIGSPVHYEMQIIYSKDIRLLNPLIPDTLGEFELLDKPETDSSLEKDKITRSVSFHLSCYDSGQKTIPPLQIQFRFKDDSIYRSLYTDSFQVWVQSMEVDTSRPPRPIKNIINPRLAAGELLPYFLALLFLLIIAFAIWYYRAKKAGKNLPFVREKPRLPPHVVAYAELRKLEDEKLWQKGEIKNYHIRLTDIVRKYLEDRFDIPAVESTTGEILEYLKDFIEDNSLIEKIKSALELSDLVKFAKFSPLPDENKFCLEVAYQLVDSTKPKLFEEEKENSNSEI